MKLLDSDNIWLKDKIVMWFLPWMSLQSSKIATLDLMAFKDYKLQDIKSKSILTR